MGASVVNALSERLDVEVDRVGKIHTMSFRRGVPGAFDGDGPAAEFSRQSGLQIAGKCPVKRTGTRVRWWADRKIFTKDADYDLKDVRAASAGDHDRVPLGDHFGRDHIPSCVRPARPR